MNKTETKPNGILTLFSKLEALQEQASLIKEEQTAIKATLASRIPQGQERKGIQHTYVQGTNKTNWAHVATTWNNLIPPRHRKAAEKAVVDNTKKSASYSKFKRL